MTRRTDAEKQIVTDESDNRFHAQSITYCLSTLFYLSSYNCM